MKKTLSINIVLHIRVEDTPHAVDAMESSICADHSALQRWLTDLGGYHEPPKLMDVNVKDYGDHQVWKDEEL